METLVEQGWWHKIKITRWKCISLNKWLIYIVLAKESIATVRLFSLIRWWLWRKSRFLLQQWMWQRRISYHQTRLRARRTRAGLVVTTKTNQQIWRWNVVIVAAGSVEERRILLWLSWALQGNVLIRSKRSSQISSSLKPWLTTLWKRTLNMKRKWNR